ncbi:aminotransferase class IV [Streptomyces sp. 891-h]|uniref:aminotransferase class IV n=1 Tax=Streptomyces sp. 891-h TaxID=2720714 RepID=UPI001FAAACED|nr:aminotransferase class IV [Streptomyces sp. 891-h]UNZ22317.1 aminotransferase [Streptomyces sp. 891-h]
MALLNGAPIDQKSLQALALTNFGHFTSMRVDEGHVRGLELHLDRLVRDCASVFDAELDRGRVRHLVHQAVGGLAGTFVVRVTVFDPDLTMGNPGADAQPSILVTRREVAAGPLPPLSVRTVEYQREKPEIKHIGLFGQLAARRAAQRAGADDALFVTHDGKITEGGTWNFGAIIDDVVVWPQGGVLPGVTMALLQEAHSWASEPVDRSDLHRVQAAFATNTSIGVRPIHKIDDRSLDIDHPVLAALRDAYAAVPGDPV